MRDFLLPSATTQTGIQIGEHIFINELVEVMFGSPALRLDRNKNENKILQVTEIKYVKFLWWKFWKRRKYVEKYHLEVIGGINR